MEKAFPGSGPEVEARYERSGHWLLATVFGSKDARDWCDRKGVTIRKAQSEGIGGAGGFLVPTELATAILDLRDQFGAFRRRACVWPMGSDSSVFPRRTGGTQAFFIGEGASAQSGAGANFNVDGVGLTAKKLAALVILSSELDEDAIVGMVDYVSNEVAWALAAKEDDCAFNGDGTSAYGGIRGLANIAQDGLHAKALVTAAGVHNTFATIDATDLANLVSAVRASALARAAWFISSVGFAQTMTRLAGGSGGGSLVTGVVDGVLTHFFNGYPVVLTQKLPQSSVSLSGQAMMAFGDMYAGAVIGQRRGLTLARSDHRFLDTDQIAILGTERFDAVVHDMGDNTNTGSLAVLVAP